MDNSKSQNYAVLGLSSRVKYALLALLELASHPASTPPLTIGEITARQVIPDRYLEQILTSLRRGGIVQSQRGARGGYSLAREAWQITLLEVVVLVEGDRPETESQETSTLERDIVREIWQQASGQAQAVLSRYTLYDLVEKRDARKQKNPMYYI
jgi:Rrf2 family protein